MDELNTNVPSPQFVTQTLFSTRFTFSKDGGQVMSEKISCVFVRNGTGEGWFLHFVVALCSGHQEGGYQKFQKMFCKSM